MHVEEAENLRLRVAEGMEDRARLQFDLIGQFDHHLHAHGPFVLPMPGGQTEVFVELTAHRAHRTIAHHRQRRTNIHIGEMHARHARALDERRHHRRSRPDLHRAGVHELAAHPLIELADGEEQSAILAQERGRVGQFHRADGAPSAGRGSPGRPYAASRERRLAPMGSSRYSTFSSATCAAMGISAGFRSGKLARMPRARVTAPETPKAISSARS